MPENNESLYDAILQADSGNILLGNESIAVAEELRAIREILMWKWLTPGIWREIERRKEQVEA